VVGVCGDVRDWFGGESEPMAYVSYRQEPPSAVRFELRTVRDPMQSAGARANGDPARGRQSGHLQREIDGAGAGRGNLWRKSGSLGNEHRRGHRAVVGADGRYSVSSFFVAQRTQEIGVRMALGASPRAIVGMVLAQTARTSAMGLGSGLLVAGALTAFMSHVLYHVVAIEPLAFVGITAMLAASALLAAYLPARRAARVDPMMALRSE
jgi:hypothetical protein